MKPKPFSSLNHLTVPLMRIDVLLLGFESRECDAALVLHHLQPPGYSCCGKPSRIGGHHGPPISSGAIVSHLGRARQEVVRGVVPQFDSAGPRSAPASTLRSGPALPILDPCHEARKGERRPADVIGNAVHVMRIATGEAEDVIIRRRPIRRRSTCGGAGSRAAR